MRGEGICVGLLDTGLLPRHPTFHEKNVVYRDFTGEGGDIHNHGTRDAALLVGEGGVCPEARLVVARVVSGMGRHMLAAGVRWAIAQGAHIIAMPLGMGRVDRSAARALAEAAASGIQLFAAAGNRGPDRHLFPAHLPDVVSVTGARRDGSIISWCCRSAQVAVVAPGWNVPALGPPGATISGSSPACVLAAGVAALRLQWERHHGPSTTDAKTKACHPPGRAR
ncbi:MAG: S8 family serine peptidase [Myxococcota bacterium]